MRSNALRKEEFFSDASEAAAKPWESRRLSIALEAEAACHLSGNQNGPDFEEFLAKYGQATISDFA